MEAANLIVVFVTSPSQEEAERLASELIEERLAACVNIAPVTSHFRWEGKPTQEAEKLLIIKTRKTLFGSLEKRVKELHSYDVPEIIALPVLAGSKEYLDWIRENLSEG